MSPRPEGAPTVWQVIVPTQLQVDITPIDASYRFLPNGDLRYFAYYRNMPINRNHNDSCDWPTGDDGVAFVGQVESAMDDPATRTDFVEVESDTSAPDEAIVVSARLGQPMDDKSFAVRLGSETDRSLRTTLQPIIDRFQAATGRPLSTLPQG